MVNPAIDSFGVAPNEASRKEPRGPQPSGTVHLRPFWQTENHPPRLRLVRATQQVALPLNRRTSIGCDGGFCSTERHGLTSCRKTMVWVEAPDFSPGKRVFKPAKVHRHALEALQAAENASFLKGTGFSPYVTTVESRRLQPPRAAISL